MKQLWLNQPSDILAQEFISRYQVEYIDTLSFQGEAPQKWLQKCLKKKQRDQAFFHLNRWNLALFEEDFRQKKRPPLIIDEVNALVGLGVFTAQDLKPLTYIGEYTGVVRARNTQRDLRNDYVFRYVESRFFAPFLIDAEKRGNFCRFLNHSDEPNLLSRSLIVDQCFHIIFFTKKAIEAGEQLTYDYGPYYWKKRATPLTL